MVHKKNSNLVIIGAGATGLASAIVFSEQYENIYILEHSTNELYKRQILARDKHAHVCVGGALAEYERLIPGITKLLENNGVAVGDPGINVKWSTSTNLLPKVNTDKKFAYGSYRSFMETLLSMVNSKPNIKVLFKVNNIVVDKDKKKIVYTAEEFSSEIDYKILLIANGSPGRENQFLNENQISYRTHILNGPCCYHSFEVELKSPLINENCFISETFPNIKDLGMLYVPRSSTSGILTLGKFGKELNIVTKEELVNALQPWTKFIPTDFISKINNISKSTDFRTQEIWWHKLGSTYNNSIFLIGDALLRVPPYTGLGFAVSIRSIISVLETIKYEAQGNAQTFNSIFENRCKDIFVRLYRYQKHWGVGVPKKVPNSLNIFSPFKIVSRIITEFIFKEAQINNSQAATVYLIERFHLIQDASLKDLLLTIFKIIVEKITSKTSKYNEKLSQSH